MSDEDIETRREKENMDEPQEEFISSEPPSATHEVHAYYPEKKPEIWTADKNKNDASRAKAPDDQK